MTITRILIPLACLCVMNLFVTLDHIRTPSHDVPIVKQKEQDCSMKLLNKQTKQKKTAKADKKLSSSKMPNGKGQMKCKEGKSVEFAESQTRNYSSKQPFWSFTGLGQSAQASVSSTSNELKSCVQQPNAIGGYHRNLFR